MKIIIEYKEERVTVEKDGDFCEKDLVAAVKKALKSVNFKID